MISHLSGQLFAKETGGIIIDVSGVGYEVVVSLTTFYHLPENKNPVSLHIYTHMNEGSISLFGFLSLQEKQLFKKLISVSGVGPKVGMAILSGFPASDIIDSIVHGNLAKLTSINGVGKKTAERLVMELKDKMMDVMTTEALHKKIATISHQPSGIYDETLSALTNLGYNRPQAEKALAMIPMETAATVEKTLREALTILAK